MKTQQLECHHRKIEECHTSYITQFRPQEEQKCVDRYEKSCFITFAKKSVTNTVQSCHRPVVKICDGTGNDTCSTVFETSCTTKYVEKQGNGAKNKTSADTR